MAPEERPISETVVQERYETGYQPGTVAGAARSVLTDSISWGAVFAGVVIALVTQIILGLVGIGIGASTLDPGTGDSPSAQALSIGAGVWYLVAGILAAAAGAYVASRLSARPSASTGAWHGLITWGATTLLMLFLVTSAVGGIVGGTLRTVTNAAGGAVSAVGEFAPDGGGMGVGMDPEVRGDRALHQALIAAARAAVTGNEEQADEAREQAAIAYSRANDVPMRQARAEVTRLEANYRQRFEDFQSRAGDFAQASTRTVSQGAWFSALGLVLGAVAAWFAGYAASGNVKDMFGGRRRYESRPAPTK